jgi:hypothetical protein
MKKGDLVKMSNRNQTAYDGMEGLVTIFLFKILAY